MAHRDTSVSALCRELGIRPVTLYRYVGPAGPAAGAGREGPRLLNRQLVTRLGLSVGFRPLPPTTRSCRRPRRRAALQWRLRTAAKEAAPENRGAVAGQAGRVRRGPQGRSGRDVRTL